jgi:hypothetical protein
MPEPCFADQLLGCSILRVDRDRGRENNCHSILEMDTPIYTCELRALMITTGSAYKSLSIIAGQSLMSITVFLANRHFTPLPLN